ncbi:hypothetical protein [Massilia sp. R2A-15]|uniref:hypothetical protein n=1 Tax=Massilia sp. R2A-15 TaxID=3064278 RepID=UPI002805D826|nr:hypothetical protein [Massilia sp. R2A-15]
MSSALAGDRAGDPRRMVARGSHLDLIGNFTPQTREADDDCSAGAQLFVDTPKALQKSGDLLGPMARGVFAVADTGGTLEALCRGQAVGRRYGGQRTVFKSVGIALEDLAATMLVMEGGRTARATFFRRRKSGRLVLMACH